MFNVMCNTEYGPECGNADSSVTTIIFTHLQQCVCGLLLQGLQCLTSDTSN